MVRAVFQGIGHLYVRSRWTRLAGDIATVATFLVLIALVHALASWVVLRAGLQLFGLSMGGGWA